MRLIDADALPKYTGYALCADEVATAVENAPTIDAVPVVRCRECKYWKELYDVEGIMFCTYVIGAEFARFSFDFCSRGERKDDE